MSPNTDRPPVRDSIRQIDDDSWLIGGRILLTRTDTPSITSCRVSWSDGNGSFFAISETEDIQNKSIASAKPRANAEHIQLVHDAGDCNAAWRIGEAFCKVQESVLLERTREHTTLTYLQDPTRPALSFPVPRPLYHAEFGGRYYLIITRLPGQTLEKAWPTMDEASRQFCVDRLVAICKELALRVGSSDTICGLDGGYLADPWLIPSLEKVKDLSPASLLRHSTELGMDCSNLVQHHCDMGPQNIIVDFTRLDMSTVGIIDWEIAGFVPSDWVRTKFRICFAMDFDFAGEDIQRSKEWRERVQVGLGREGYHEVGEAWKAKWEQALATRLD